MNNNVRSEYYRKDIKQKIPHSKYSYKQNIKEDIDYYRNNDNYNREEDNIRRHEIYHKNSKEKITKYNKIPYMNNYNKNYSSSNIKRTTNNKLNNRIYDYNYNNKIKKLSTSTNLNERNRINNSYRINNYINNNKREYSSNIDPNKLKSVLKVEEKTASLSFKNPQKRLILMVKTLMQRNIKENM